MKTKNEKVDKKKKIKMEREQVKFETAKAIFKELEANKEPECDTGCPFCKEELWFKKAKFKKLKKKWCD